MNFAIRITNLCRFLIDEKHEHKISDQLFRSGTSIGANVAESQYAQSRADFLTKMTIALKEANETHFWLARLRSGENLTDKEYESVNSDCEEIIKLLTSITATVKGT